MNRSSLITALESYSPWNEREDGFRNQILELLRTEPDCFHRSLLTGHITGSALIVDPDRTQALMMFHSKLEMWLQPGGHADGNENVLEVALRESEEETGLSGFRVVQDTPFDLDVHPIPARGAEPAHFHYDVRFLLEADPKWELTANSESRSLQWIPLETISQFNTDESVTRMVEKAGQM